MGAESRGRMGELGSWTKSSMVRKWPEWRGFEEQGRQEAGKGPGMYVIRFSGALRSESGV